MTENLTTQSETPSPPAPLAALIRDHAKFANDARISDLWADLVAVAANDPSLEKLQADLTNPSVEAMVCAIFAGSPYLQGLILREPARFQRILASDPDAQSQHIIGRLPVEMAAAQTLANAQIVLRTFKAEMALLTALADLGGIWPVMRVTDNLTKAADAAVQTSVRFLFREAAVRGNWFPADPGSPEAQSGYIVLGMGKYGAHELNYSSDIDLIVFFDAARNRVAGHLEPPSFFVRLTRDLVRLLAEHTAGGYVFRTDLRLRPDPGATQIALSVDAAFHYYETVGQNWERAALIKARPVAGDIAAGREMLEALAPFIWRKYLDFASIADIHAMKRQIHAHRGFGTIGVSGHNIKLGPGGIREIEFFVQTQQLIAGGRQTGLRSPRTLEALDALVSHDWIASGVARELSTAYLELRRIEHRLQMVADEQTHELPNQVADLERFARFAGFADLETFSTELVHHLEIVQGHYAHLFEGAPELTTRATNMVFAGESDDPATVAALAAMGYSQPSQALAIVRAWHHGRYRAMRSPQSRERLTEVQPLLIETLGATADPDSALANFDRFLADLPSGVQLFALMKARPGLLRLIADIMGSAPRLARILSRRRRLFDAVLDSRTFGALPALADFEKMLAAVMPKDAGYEAVLDAARVVGSEQMFLIGVRVLAGAISASEAGAAYAALAEALIAAFHTRIACDFKSVHGSYPGDGAAVLALGKLGGREMTATSDLDLIVIYDAPPEAITGAILSDGPKPLPAALYFGRFTQRLVSALSAPTAEGLLYEVDLRLRPSGQKGPLATLLASFIAYQANEAWTWEHMSLTRARVISGSPPMRAKVSAAIVAVLTRPRDAMKIAADVRDMRSRIESEKGTSDIWELKQVRGGLIDLEFISQHLQLIHAAHSPGVLDPNTRKSLGDIFAAGHISVADAERLMAAARLYTNLTGVLRLSTDGVFDAATAPRGVKDRLTQAVAAPSFSALEVEIKDTQGAVRSAYERLILAPATEAARPGR